MEIGDVVQINEKMPKDHKGWIGAFVLVTEVKSWGIQGFVHHIDTHEECSRAYIRLTNEQFDFVGKATLIPADEL